MRKRHVLVLAVIPALAAFPAFASTEATGTNAVSPTLKVNVTVQSAVRLTLATGSQCNVTTGGGADYSITFGTVDALGIATPTCGAKFAPTTPGSTNAAYYTDYLVTPMFTSQSVSTNTVTAYVSNNFGLGSVSIVQSSSAPSAVGDLTAMGTTVGTATTVASNATSGTALTRYIGVSVSPTNGGSMTGPASATITYTMTVQ